VPRTGLTQEELRQRALDAAEREIRHGGAARVRLTDVAREVGVSHAALYKLFDDREALLDAVSARWLQRIDAGLEEIAASARPPLARLRAWLLALHRAKREKVQADPQLYAAFDVAAQGRKPFVREHMENSRRQLEQIAADALRAGDLHGKSARSVARLVYLGTAAFHHPRMVAEALAEDREPELKAVTDALLAGLGAR
jgi:AcrR family transcriptional regulator